MNVKSVYKKSKLKGFSKNVNITFVSIVFWIGHYIRNHVLNVDAKFQVL